MRRYAAAFLRRRKSAPLRCAVDREHATDTAATLEKTLALVVERIGDPAPRVYDHLFGATPELRAMFVND